jgi:cytochrome b6-f complex iron-sulfur subunit
MADDEVKNTSEQQPPRKPLPPLTSAKPLPPLSSARPASPKPSSPALQPQPATPAADRENAVIPDVSPVASLMTKPATQSVTPVKQSSEVRKPRQDKPPENDQGIWRMSRKNFLNVAAWFGFLSFLFTATIGAIRLMVPRVLYEAPSAFKAGYPEDYIVGEVNEKYKDEFRVWIVREADGFYALSAICTHLGCTPRWATADNKFKCPCHGSGYHKDGVNFEGPTPRPLERLKITLGEDGQILVDRNIKFLYEKQEWSKPDAFLKYS